MSTPRLPASDTLIANASGTAFASYGPRVELDMNTDGYRDIEPCRPSDAQYWSVYEWDDANGGVWIWVADCITDDFARLLCEAMTAGA